MNCGFAQFLGQMLSSIDCGPVLVVGTGIATICLSKDVTDCVRFLLNHRNVFENRNYKRNLVRSIALEDVVNTFEFLRRQDISELFGGLELMDTIFEVHHYFMLY